jgi:hypothetical protein
LGNGEVLGNTAVADGVVAVAVRVATVVFEVISVKLAVEADLSDEIGIGIAARALILGE